MCPAGLSVPTRSSSVAKLTVALNNTLPKSTNHREEKAHTHIHTHKVKHKKNLGYHL